MPDRVAVSGGSPTWRRGLGAVLADAGYMAVESNPLSDWRPGRDGIAVIFNAGSDTAADEIAAFVDDHPHVPLIAVVAELALSEFSRLVRAGARAVLGEQEPTDDFITVLQAAVVGRNAIPFDLARSLVARIPASPAPGAWVSEKEAQWLRHLAEGSTVGKLAETVGYSEREMFRILGEMYLRIGVKNRTEAIIWASRHGILDGDG